MEVVPQLLGPAWTGDCFPIFPPWRNSFRPDYQATPGTPINIKQQYQNTTPTGGLQ